MATVMLVEDNVDVCYLAAFLLRADGHTVIEPETWESLLNADVWADVDVAVVDLLLRDEITGVHVLGYLKSHMPAIRRIVFTSSLDESDGDAAYEEALLLADVFVSKFDAADGLIEAVRG